MDDNTWIDDYYLHQQEWESFQHLHDSFTWRSPGIFNIAEYVCDRWADKGQGTAILLDDDYLYREHSYSFQFLKEYSNRLANYLDAKGIRKGDRVGVRAPQIPETIISHLGIWKVGAVSVPLSPQLGPRALLHRIDNAGIKVCIAHQETVKDVSRIETATDGLEEILIIDSGGEVFFEHLSQYPANYEIIPTSSKDDAVIFYTSGTTGTPKGVLHGHEILLGHLPGFITSVCNLELYDDRFWTPTDWSWIASLISTNFCALFFGKPILGFNGGPFDPEAVFRLIDQYKITCCFIPPTALRMMGTVDDPTDRFDTGTVRVIASGGESLNQELVEWSRKTFDNAVIHELFGQTESGGFVIVECERLGISKDYHLGVAGPGYDVEILDPETMSPFSEPGEIGEIGVKYSGNLACFKKYWDRPLETAEKIQNGWLLTGDLGQKYGCYFQYVSRKDDIIITSGYRIGPQEIEEALISLKYVADAGVVGIPDDQRGTIPKAYVVLTDDTEPTDKTKARIQQHVKSSLAKYEYPREIAFVSELPRTNTGKIQRTKLTEL